jgi:TRAP-type C4-dicarboxylate transport system permease small subunit
VLAGKKSKEGYFMQKGMHARRRKSVALVLSSLILIELVAALFFVGMDFISSGSFDATSATDLLRAAAALASIGVGVFAGIRLYAILAWKSSQRPGGNGSPGNAP